MAVLHGCVGVTFWLDQKGWGMLEVGLHWPTGTSTGPTLVLVLSSRSDVPCCCGLGSCRSRRAVKGLTDIGKCKALPLLLLRPKYDPIQSSSTVIMYWLGFTFPGVWPYLSLSKNTGRCDSVMAGLHALGHLSFSSYNVERSRSPPRVAVDVNCTIAARQV
jgi:hypothetical protein